MNWRRLNFEQCGGVDLLRNRPVYSWPPFRAFLICAQSRSSSEQTKDERHRDQDYDEGCHFGAHALEVVAHQILQFHFLLGLSQPFAVSPATYLSVASRTTHASDTFFCFARIPRLW